ncbi:hypothetical protein KKD37_01615 [Patescibacteria group bacterium]|nr:hypothetical protein [Patescibacteria group bacterium]
MAQRTNLTTKSRTGKYILGFIFLSLLSVGGIYWLSSNKNKVEVPIEREEIAVTPATVVEEEAEAEKVEKEVAPLATPTAKLIEEFRSESDAFAVSYKGSRKLYQDTESSGRRYTFYDYAGNIVVHVGKSWSWLYPERTYTDKLLVDGENSFVYEISNQKIVDVEINGLKYTIQCIHNSKEDLKTECEEFIENFKFI